MDWQASGLVRPAVLIEATASYFDEQDLPSQWIEQCCDCGPNKSDTAARLFGSWKAFAEVNGEKPESSKWFNQTLTNLGFTATKSTPGARGHRGFLGIALKPLGMGPD
jgi:putative DNA primase/helicase